MSKQQDLGSTYEVVVIGGGPAGLTAAYELERRGINTLLLEKSDSLGGMCSTKTYGDGVMAENGAVLIAPYFNILTYMRRHKIKPKDLFPLRPLPTEKKFKGMGFFKKFVFACHVFEETTIFNLDVLCYNFFKHFGKTLPTLYTKPFDHYLRSRKFRFSHDVYQCFIPGCGYGAFDDIPTWQVLEYLGYFTIPTALLTNHRLKGITGGYQSLFTTMGSDIHHLLNVHVNDIQRDKQGITLTFKHQEKEHQIRAKQMILTAAPNVWSVLGLTLTEAEKRAVQALRYHRYPVMICNIKSMPKECILFEKAFHSKTFNRVALITTCDDREAPEEGRLCSVYLNVNESFDESLLSDDNRTGLQTMITEMIREQLPEAEVQILDIKSWQYRRALTWEARRQLLHQQGELNTYYAGSYLSFESVGRASETGMNALHAMKKIPFRRIRQFFHLMINAGYYFFLYFFMKGPKAS